MRVGMDQAAVEYMNKVLELILVKASITWIGEITDSILDAPETAALPYVERQVDASIEGYNNQKTAYYAWFTGYIEMKNKLPRQ
jgi:hypothetical protein